MTEKKKRTGRELSIKDGKGKESLEGEGS